MDWSEGDGFFFVVFLVLFLGFCGIGMIYIDIGLYIMFGVLGLKRLVELLFRFVEMVVFLLVMRIYEGMVCENYLSYDIVLYLFNIFFIVFIICLIIRFKEIMLVFVIKV